MHIRMVLALALFLMPVFGGYGLQASHGGFCTVAEIEQWYFAGESLQAIQEHCQVLDVGRCDTTQVYFLIDDGYTLADVYYTCR